MAIPVTVFVITNSEQDSKSAQALTNFELNDCATNRDPAGNSQCGHTPGNPDDYYFCDRWTGGFCNDYRYIQLNNATGEREFGTDPRDSVSVDCLSSTNAGQTSWLPYYVPTNMTAWDASDVPGKQDIPFPCAFSKYEHFMTRMEDGQFGMVIMRQKRPLILLAVPVIFTLIWI